MTRASRDELRMRQENRCFYCNKTMTPTPKGCRPGVSIKHLDSEETIDHTLPQHIAGRTFRAVLACSLCNAKKGRLSSFEYLGLKWFRFMFLEAAGR